MKKINMKFTIHTKKTILIIILSLIELIIFCFGFSLGKQSLKNPHKESKKSFDDKILMLTEEKMKELSVSDMIYQMMFITPESITNSKTVVSADASFKNKISCFPVGGIVFFASNLKNEKQTTKMIAKMQEYSGIPLFIGVDEEGGKVSRLGNNPDMNTTAQPSMKTIGASKNPKKAYIVGQTLGSELFKLGFNVDFAPDADLLINQNNFEIGDRSFGTDPYLVADMVKSFVNGIQKNKVSAALKHFPGHGSTSVNSHTGYCESRRSLKELRKNEFLPFKAGIDAGADFTLVSHMTLVNATKAHLPSSLSKEVITDMLINELGYDGIIITDSFSMGAITKNYSAQDAAVKAINAGADMILMPSDLLKAHDAVFNSVKSGEIPISRIKKSVKKILMLKAKKGLLK